MSADGDDGDDDADILYQRKKFFLQFVCYDEREKTTKRQKIQRSIYSVLVNHECFPLSGCGSENELRKQNAATDSSTTACMEEELHFIAEAIKKTQEWANSRHTHNLR